MALLPGSPAINAGTATGAPTTDQRGISRVGAVDIGAFESRGFTISAASGTPQSATILSAFGSPLIARSHRCRWRTCQRRRRHIYRTGCECVGGFDGWRLNRERQHRRRPGKHQRHGER